MKKWALMQRHSNLKIKIIYLLVASLLLILAYMIQNLGLLAGDVGSLLYDTKLMLGGGTYVTDFMETNPPMIFYLYSPVVILGKLFSLNLTLLFRIYVLVLIFISVTLCIKLLTRIFDKKEEYEIQQQLA